MAFTRNRGIAASAAVIMAVTAGAFAVAPAQADQDAQELSWEACPEELLSDVPAEEQDLYTCTVVETPLDYSDPDAGEVGTTLVRREAGDPDQSQGSLLVNRGGPGMSGTVTPGSMADQFEAEVLEQYDLVGFDPRGMTLDCFDSPEEREEVMAGISHLPLTGEEEQATFDAFAAYAEACEGSGELASHVSSTNIAHDLDLIREALGDEQLNFVGMSYGTMIASVYAGLYPENTGALVMDSPVDAPLRASRPMEYDSQRAQASEDALGELLSQCEAAGENCPFGGGQPSERFEEIREGLKEDGPIETEDGEVVSASSFTETTGSLLMAGTEETGMLLGWLQMVSEAMDAPADASEEPTADLAGVPGQHVAPEAEEEADAFYNQDAFYSINCADRRYPSTTGLVSRYAEKWDKTMPTFGKAQAYEQFAACAQWSGSEAPSYKGPWEASLDTPPLVMAKSHDAVTPMAFASRTAERFPGAGTVEVEDFGHVVLGSNSCANALVTDYLVNGEVPGENVTCDADVSLFG